MTDDDILSLLCAHCLIVISLLLPFLLLCDDEDI